MKTQVAVAIADQHLLEKKQKENLDKATEWMHRAELAVDKKHDDLARTALERSMSYKQIGDSFEQQVADQKLQVENLKTALHKLDQKLAEAQSKSDLLIAQHRRSRAITKASDAQLTVGDQSKGAAFDRMKNKIARSEAVSQAKSQMVADDMDDRFAALEKEDQIDKLLAELKSRRGVTA